MIRILFLADTHLGFDFPFRPRVVRRRRGPDFFDNLNRALAPALEGRVDCVIHGGDLLFRSKVPPKLVDMAFEPLKGVADTGVPVFLVPGNHERSVIPENLFTFHPNIFIFRRPKTFIQSMNGIQFALSGFPNIRENIRGSFKDMVEQTGWRSQSADARVLCMHQSVEGATVGPSNYTFRSGHDVVRIGDVPDCFDAVLSGHIHRFQVLTQDLKGFSVPTPVFYPGSVERTSFAERHEEKGYLIIEIEIPKTASGHSAIRKWTFHPLPTRPLYLVEIHAAKTDRHHLKASIQRQVSSLPGDSVVKLRIHGQPGEDTRKLLQASSLRSLFPDSMNISIGFPSSRSKR